MKTSFGPFTLDLGARQLTDGERELHLSPKAFELLTRLIADRPNALSKAVLQEYLWPGTFVVEANVSNLIAEIRETLGDSARAPRYVRTVHGFGYAFCADVASVSAAPEAPDAHDTSGDSPLCWLKWGRQVFPLGAGEHIIGRDADIEVMLDGTTVSRRHARLIVTHERTVLEDCGSKNGTFLGEQRVTSPVQLAEGDTVRIGSLLLTFHLRAHSTTTDTHVQASP